MINLPRPDTGVSLQVCVCRLLWLTPLCLGTNHSACSHSSGPSGLETQQLYCVCMCVWGPVHSLEACTCVCVLGGMWLWAWQGLDVSPASPLTIQFSWIPAHCVQCNCVVLHSSRVEQVHISEMFVQNAHVLSKDLVFLPVCYCSYSSCSQLYSLRLWNSSSWSC